MKTKSDFTINALAQLSGFDRRTLSRVLNGSYPEKKGGPWTLTEFCHAVRHHYTGKVIDQRERRARVQADLAELTLAERKENLLDADAVQFFLTDFAVRLRSGFMQMADHVASLHEQSPDRMHQLRECIDAHVRDLLTQASNPAYFEEGTGKPAPSPICQACEVIKQRVAGTDFKPGMSATDEYFKITSEDTESDSETVSTRVDQTEKVESGD